MKLNTCSISKIANKIISDYSWNHTSSFTLRLKPNHTSNGIQFSSVWSLSHVWHFATPWTTARQASLSITNSWSPPKPMSVESVMPSNHLILCPPLLLPSILPSIRIFSNESSLCIRWPKCWSFSFNIKPSQNSDWNLNPQSGTQTHCLFFFNWRIIGLQCCVGSCHTTWISNKSTYFPSLVALPLILHSIPHPSRLSQSAVLSSVYYTAASRQLSILLYGHVYVSMLFSQFVPPSPSPSVSTSLFSVSASGTHCLLIKITYWSSGSLCLSA